MVDSVQFNHQNGFCMIPAKAGAAILDILQTVVLAVGIFLVVYLFLLRPHQVKGESMVPNFEDGEYLLTSQLSYHLGDPKRGDVVIFAAPPVPTEDYIKRIIALPGEKVSIHVDKVFINGQELHESYIPEGLQTFPGPFLPTDKEYTVPDGEYFVLGDNRPNSSDSRRWGPVKRQKIVGKAWIIYWPPQRTGVVKSVSY